VSTKGLRSKGAKRTDRDPSTRGRKPRPVSPESRAFGAQLAVARARVGLTQAEVAEQIGLSGSFLAKIERGVANADLNRAQVWLLIGALKIKPADCDAFLTAAGQSTDRTPFEEMFLQQTLDYQEVWVFSRSLSWLCTGETLAFADDVHLERVHYKFFVPDVEPFNQWLRRFIIDARFSWSWRHPPARRVPLEIPDDIAKALKRNIRCFVLPRQFFTTDFCIYNPGADDMYCCGSKLVRGEPYLFFTNTPTESEHLFQMLKSLLDQIGEYRITQAGKPQSIDITPLAIAYPPSKVRQISFKSEPRAQGHQGIDIETHWTDIVRSWDEVLNKDVPEARKRKKS
jgi:transcriptional regulator with XRE-family HTH domain